MQWNGSAERMHSDRCGGCALPKWVQIYQVLLLLLVQLALAAPASADDLTYSFGGDASWISQSAVSHAGGTAYQSGAISNSQTSWMESTVAGPGLIQFWWKVSSESCCDPLRFSIDGTPQADIRGEIDWQNKRFAVPSGTHTLRWSYSTDGSILSGRNAGWLDQVSFTAGSNFDLSPPTTSATPQGGTFASGQSVTLACLDGTGSGCAGTFYCRGGGCTPTTPYSSAISIPVSTDLRFYSTDSAGNSEAVKDVYFTIDITPPATYPSPPAGTYSGGRDVALNCSDYGLGCASTFYCLGSNCTPATPYVSPLRIAASTELRYYSVDYAGNTEGVQTASFAITPDVTPPSTNLAQASGPYRPFYPNFWCSDGAGSGCAATYYCLGTGCIPTTLAADNPIPRITRSTDFSIYSVDQAGNAEPVQTRSYTIDSDPPVTTASAPGGIYTTAQSVTLSCSDASGSGCSSTYYCLGKNCSPYTPYSQYTGPIGVPYSTSLTYYSRDRASNTEESKTERYTIRSGPGSTINVPADQATIQGAIDAAKEGDAVLVAPGTYRENLDFKGKAISVTASGAAEATVIDAGRAGPAASFVSGEWRTTVLEGFTLRDGYTIYNMPGSGFGGGIRIDHASPTVRNNRILNNAACAGNGVSVTGGAPLLQGNLIADNVPAQCGYAYGGGGIYLSGTSGAEVLDNDIHGNLIGGGNGGGIFSESAINLTVRGNIIRGNSTPGAGGGIAMTNPVGVALVENVLAGNHAASSGGLYWSGPVNEYGPATLLNNTIAGNDAPQGSGMLVTGNNASAVMVNNLIVARSGQTALQCESNQGYNDGVPPQLSYNLAFSAGGSAFGGICSDLGGQNGNQSADPLIPGASLGYVGLPAGSPAIDAGDASSLLIPAADLGGSPRILAGSPGGAPRIDLGAYEYDPDRPQAALSGAPTGAVRDAAVSISVGGSGIASYRYALDGGAFTSADTPVSTPIVLPSLAGGVHTVAVVGKSSTREQSETLATAAQWTVDSVPPLTTATPGSGSYATAQSVTLSCDDGTGSGCAGTFYCLGGGCTPDIPYSAPIPVNSNAGLHYYSIDRFGNREGTKSASYSFTGTISGKVSDRTTGLPLVTAMLKLTNAVSGSTVVYSSPDSGGTYRFPNLPSGSYKIEVTCAGYLDQWYSGKGDRATATTISLEAPVAATGLDVALVRGGSITGSVTSGSSGAGIGQISVATYDAASGLAVTNSYTDNSGRYTVSGLPTGSYKLLFNRNGVYLEQWYRDKGDISSASVVAVTEAATTSGIDVSLALGGSISGKVTESGSGAALPGVYVHAYQAGTDTQTGAGSTDSSGAYTITGLSGRYQIQFTESGYQSRWYGGASQSAATVVTASTSQSAAGVDVQLPKLGAISGTVSDRATGAGIYQASVTAYDAATGQSVARASTDVSGNYSITGLPTGSYQVYLSAPGFLPQWSGAHADRGSALAIAVSAPKEVGGVNAALVRGNPIAGAITGTVTDKLSGAAIPDIYVSALDPVSGNQASAMTDGAGVYRLTGLAAGGYQISYYSLTGYLETWYNNKGPSAADTVQVSATGTTSGIDAALVKGGSLAGKVTDSQTGLPLQSAWVWLTSPTGDTIASGSVDLSGSYRINNVPPGSYTVLFQRSGYLNHDSSVTVSAATTSTLDASLSLGGSISGVIADRSSGVGIADATISAFDRVTGALVGGVTTRSDGSYSITGLPSGAYRLQLTPLADSGFIGGMLDGHGVSTCPETVSVTAPDTTAGVGALLDAGGSITGRLTDAATSFGIRNATVFISSQVYSAPRSAQTDSSGDYGIGGLPSGAYRLSFLAPGYLPPASQLAVTLTAPEAAVAADASLVQGGGISGTVTDRARGTGIAGLPVTATDAASGNLTATATTDGSGYYAITALPGGSYRIGYRIGGELSTEPVLPPTGGDVNVQDPGSASFSSDEQVFMPSAILLAAPVATCVETPVAAQLAASLSAAPRVAALSAGTVSSVPASGSPAPVVLPAPLDPVAVSAPTVTTGIDFAVDPMGGISGTVSDRVSGDPIQSVQVSAYPDGSDSASGSAFTDSAGRYSLVRIPTGSYRIGFRSGNPAGGGYLAGWYQGAASSGTASRVAVQAPATAAGSDVQLERGAGISGTVSAPVCPGPALVRIAVYDAATGTAVGSTTTMPDLGDSFTVGSLAPGSYKLAIIPIGTGFIRQWYPNKSDAASAEPVALTAGSVTGGINVALAAGGGSISGTVTGDTGCSLQLGGVKLYDWFSEGLVAEGSVTGARYSLTGLPDGTYKLLYQVNGQPRWYRASGELTDATPLVVSGGSALTAINHTESCSAGGELTVLDALKALRIAVGLDLSTPELAVKYDVAPVLDGVPEPDGKIDLADALVLLQRALHAPVPAQSNQ